MKKYEKWLRPRVRPSRLGWAACVLAAGVALVLGNAAYRAQQQSVALEAGNQRLRVQAERDARERAKPVSAAHLAQWNGLQKERSVDWEGMFQVIEEATTKDIELLEFAPDKQYRRITLRGEAKDNKALVAYLDALTSHPRLRDVRLVRRELVEWEKLVTVEFQIEGNLR